MGMGAKTIRKADTQSKNMYKGSQERVQRESRPSGRRTHHPRKGTKGVNQGYNGFKTIGKADTQSQNRYKGSQEGVQRESRPSGRRTHHPRRGTKLVKKRYTASQGRTHNPRTGTKGVKKGYNGSQDHRQSGHTIQEQVQHKSRRLGKADTLPKNRYKGSQEGVQRKGATPSKKGYKRSQDL